MAVKYEMGNYQCSLVAVKIDDIGFDDLLAAKVNPLQTAGAQPRPQFALCRGQVAAHFLGALEFVRCDCLLGDEAFGGHEDLSPGPFP
jgi:hypothetical protein